MSNNKHHNTTISDIIAAGVGVYPTSTLTENEKFSTHSL